MNGTRLSIALAALLVITTASHGQQPGTMPKTGAKAQPPAKAKNGAIPVTKVGPGAAWGAVDLKIYALKNAVAQDLARILEQVLAAPGRVVRAIPDARTNSVIVVSDPDLTAVVEALVARLDVPVGGALPRP